MKRHIKLLLLVGCTVVLVAVYSFCSFFFSQEDDVTYDEQTYTVGMISDITDLSSIEWTLEEETVKLVKIDEKWFVDGKNDFPLDTDIVADMIDQIDMVEASYAIKDVQELAQYGVDAPKLTVKYTLGEQSVIYYFGIENSMTGEYYLMKDGEQTVYLVDYALHDVFDYTLTELALIDELPALSDVTQITVERADAAFTVVREEIEASEDSEESTVKWTVEESEADGASLIEALVQLDILECVAYAGEDADLTPFGFDDRYVHITVDYNVTTHQETGEVDEEGNAVTEQIVTPYTFEITLAVTEDGSAYGKLSDSTLVYSVTAETVTAFIEFALT